MPVCVAVCRIPYGQLQEEGVNFCLTACEQKECWLHVKHLDEFIDKFL